MRRSLLAAYMLLGIMGTALGQKIEAPQIPNGFTFDGQVTDEEWGSIPTLGMTMSTPVHQGELSQASDIRLAYDDTYIYLSGVLHDSDPEKINSTVKLRDGGDESSDFFGFIIDSYNDKQNALCFFTTPTGSRWDASIQNDAGGRNPMNLSWNNFWDVKTTRDDRGWYVEMRVPFRSLQYQIIDDQVTMGITVWRYIARANEMQICPDISPDFGDMGSFRPSLATEYVFRSVKKKKPLYITPYVLGGVGINHELAADGSDYVSNRQGLRDIGADVKIGLTNNFTMDLTVNTDFAQVEADDQQINLTRFSLFFPEKRLFFQERSGIFDFAFGQRNNLFYSRRIGINSDGSTIPIIGGARVTGRADDIDLGVISMQTASTDDNRSTNYSVFRIKKQVLNQYSQLGLLATRVTDIDGQQNTVVGMDASLRLFRDDFLTLKVAQSHSSGVDSKLLSVDPTAFWISMSNRSQGGFSYGMSYSRLGKDFGSDIGFLERSDYSRLGTRYTYNFFKDESSRFLRHGVSIRGASWWDNATDRYNSGFYNLRYEWQWKNGTAFSIGPRLRYDDILEEFSLADVATVRVGDYLYPSLSTEFNTANGRAFRLSGEVTSGAFFDGRRTQISLNPVYNISSSFNLSGTYEYNDVRFSNRNQAFAAHILRIKGLVMFSTKLSISSFIQYNSLDKLYLGNIRLRYNPREGNDLFIVYNSDFNADRDLFRPELPVYNTGSLLVKYSYTFSL